LDYKRGN
jgi:hypothetical protein